MLKGNICKQKAKRHIILNVSKSKNMRRYFEANSITKYINTKEIRISSGLIEKNVFQRLSKAEK